MSRKTTSISVITIVIVALIYLATRGFVSVQKIKPGQTAGSPHSESTLPPNISGTSPVKPQSVEPPTDANETPGEKTIDNTIPLDTIQSHSTVNPLSGMVRIPGGTFLMGSPEGVGDSNEHPQHRVTITGFYMDSTEVTQEQFSQVMGFNPSHFKGCSNCPVDSVSWEDACKYCRRIGKRLPTEAQWEYAARAGSSSNYFWGDTMNGTYTWHYGNSDNSTHPVAQKNPNAFGLYDMIGNVWEWCSDWYSEDYYSKSVPQNPPGPDSGKFNMTRGGGFGYNRDGYILRSAYRNCYPFTYRNINIGFRCVR